MVEKNLKDVLGEAQPAIKDLVMFRSDPTLEDLAEAEEKPAIIFCRVTGTTEECAETVEKIKKRLGDKFFSSLLFLDGRFIDEDVLPQDKYEEMILDMCKQIQRM